MEMQMYGGSATLDGRSRSVDPTAAKHLNNKTFSHSKSKTKTHWNLDDAAEQMIEFSMNQYVTEVKKGEELKQLQDIEAQQQQ